MPGYSRSFTSFAQAADEAGESRVVGGIHFSFDNTAGLAAGREIGSYITQNFLLPSEHSSGGAGSGPGPGAPTDWATMVGAQQTSLLQSGLQFVWPRDSAAEEHPTFPQRAESAGGSSALIQNISVNGEVRRRQAAPRNGKHYRADFWHTDCTLHPVLT
jgi:hypothetical protein